MAVLAGPIILLDRATRSTWSTSQPEAARRGYLRSTESWPHLPRSRSNPGLQRRKSSICGRRPSCVRNGRAPAALKKEGLFDPTQPLFPDMIVGNYEEWTVLNRTLSDHPFHLHQNHVLITKINGITLPQPEWHDTLDVPGIVCPATDPGCSNPINVNNFPPGSITFRTYFNPVTVGCFVGHCHTLDHEDLGMMQRFDILPAPGQPSGCSLDDRTAAAPFIEKFITSRSNLQICSASRQPRPIFKGAKQ